MSTDLKDFWKQVLSSMETSTSMVCFEVWLQSLTPVDIIDGKLDDCGIAHDWHKEAQGKTYLLFRAEDAPSLVRAFDEMSRAVDAAKEKASAELAAEFARARERARDLGKDRAHGDHARTGANERLADKAEMAKAAAEELRKNAHEVPDRERTFNRERAQGR